jgi:hypothetical protein
MNQCVFKHSARKLPLKDSIYALSVGLPGREKPKVPRSEIHDHVVGIGPKIQVARDELTAVIDPDRLWIADLPTYALERLHHIFPPVAEPGGLSLERSGNRCR